MSGSGVCTQEAGTRAFPATGNHDLHSGARVGGEAGVDGFMVELGKYKPRGAGFMWKRTPIVRTPWAFRNKGCVPPKGTRRLGTRVRPGRRGSRAIQVSDSHSLFYPYSESGAETSEREVRETRGSLCREKKRRLRIRTERVMRQGRTS